jgi:A/G-specific adenine glycosylase
LRLKSLQIRLLDWYARHQRQLPWRSTRDPYAILVSEIMLQQTQVERVLPKYVEFLTLFPTIEALAGAARADVIRAWSPLGYNRRAVRLHTIARVVVEERDGILPRDVEELIAFEGLGRYTAAAVACFAFGRQVAAIDTNVRRVVRRIRADQWASREPSTKEIDAEATRILPPGRAEDWNQALMDLGAGTCTARSPACWRCPVSDLCPSRVDAETTTYPNDRSVLRAAEKQASYSTRIDTSAGRFEGSSRFYRGRVVEHLRRLAPGSTIAIDDLGSAVRNDFSGAERKWLLVILLKLQSDGLVRLEPSSIDKISAEAIRVALA